MNGKDYSFREMVYDQCFSTGKEYTCKQLMEIVNHKLKSREKQIVSSRTTFMQDIQEMNEKLFRLYGRHGIVWEDRHRVRYYRYRHSNESIYNRELAQEEVERLQEVRDILQGFKGMPDFGWMDQMMTRLDQNIIGKRREIASFEGGTIKDTKLLMPLFKAIKERRVLSMRYQNFYREADEIVVHPYYLKQYWRRWYLMARKEGEEEITALALDYMEDVTINKEVKYRPAKTSFKEYFKDMVGVTMPAERGVEHIELWADMSLVPQLASSPIHGSQQLVMNDNRSCTVTLDVMVNYELMQELMYYGDRLVVKAPAYLRDKMMERLEWCKNSYMNVGEDRPVIEGVEPQLFAFNYLHQSKDDWKGIGFRISLGLLYYESSITDLSIDWGYVRKSLERIVEHSHTVIELGMKDDADRIELKKVGELLDITVMPDKEAEGNGVHQFQGFAQCNDVVRELYYGLLEMANAYPEGYMDGCPFTQGVVSRELKSTIIENYLNEE